MNHEMDLASKLYYCVQFMQQLFRARGYGFQIQRWTQSVQHCRVVVTQLTRRKIEWLKTSLHGQQSSHRISAIFMLHDSVKQSNKTPIIELIQTRGLTRILVVTDNISALVLEQIHNLHCEIEHWKPIDCFTNAAHHYSAPKMAHTNDRLPPSYRFTRCRLSDPVARFYGFREGDVIKIDRQTHVGINIEHRIVEKEKIKVNR